MRQPALILILIALAAAPSFAAPESGTAFDRYLDRLVATPTPAGPFLLASDHAVWRVDVPEGTIVTVEAQGTPTAPFYLRAEQDGAAQPSFYLPTSHAGFILSHPGAWRVGVDPAGGASVEITVRFRGHVGDVTGTPAAFTLTPVSLDHGCILPSVCLP